MHMYIYIMYSIIYIYVCVCCIAMEQWELASVCMLKKIIYVYICTLNMLMYPYVSWMYPIIYPRIHWGCQLQVVSARTHPTSSGVSGIRRAGFERPRFGEGEPA